LRFETLDLPPREDINVRPRLLLVSAPLVASALLLTVGAGPAAAQEFGVASGVGRPRSVLLRRARGDNPLVDRLRFRPNVEIGLGDDVTLSPSTSSSPISFRPPGLELLRRCRPALNLPIARTTPMSRRFNILLGGPPGRAARIGRLIDSPDVKFGVGYVFAEPATPRPAG
jgi:hypothetical protein